MGAIDDMMNILDDEPRLLLSSIILTFFNV